MPTIDLHSHSTASDGTFSPTELVAAASEVGLTHLALTDHDTTGGLSEAALAAEGLGLTLIPGIELTTQTEPERREPAWAPTVIQAEGRDRGGQGQGDRRNPGARSRPRSDETAASPVGALQADILGYFIDPEHAALQALLAQLKEARHGRAKEMVAKLQAVGARIEFDEVAALARDGLITRPHVAQALVDAGFVRNIGEAFGRWIGRGCPAFVDRFRLTPEAACRLVREAGGLPSLAHPVPSGRPRSDPLTLRLFLPRLADAGLVGLECYYWRYGAKTSRWLEALAWNFGLVPTGGSDFHGARRDNVLGGVAVPEDTVERLMARLPS